MPGKKVIATVECRMTSSRLPGKVMMKSCGKPMLQLLVERLKRIPRLDDVVLATTTNELDDVIVDMCRSIGVKCFRGSEEDVLKRVLEAADSVKADVIVEITGDCPLIDPDITAQTLDLYLNNECDYASNCLFQSYPLGMEVEVFSTDLLRIADQEGKTVEDREHVSWFFVRNPKRFRLITLPAPTSLIYPHLRLTLDEKADYDVINAIFEGLYARKPEFRLSDVIEFLSNNPEIVKLNEKIVHRGSWENIRNK